jgi:O-antigen ligase
MRKGFLTRGVLIAGLATVMAGGVSFVPARTIERVLTVSNSSNFGNRLPIWEIALRVFSDHPALGIGAGAFLPAGGANYVAHNTFLSVLVEQGILGFVVFLGIVGALIAGIWQMRGQGRYAWITLLICWCVGVSTLTWEQSRWTWALFAMAAALPHSGEDEVVPVGSVPHLMSGAD